MEINMPAVLFWPAAKSDTQIIRETTPINFKIKKSLFMIFKIRCSYW